jgi:poly(A) polymerase
VPKRVRALLDHPRFRAAYDFLVLRTEAGELPPDRAAFWTEVQEEGVDPEEAFAAVVAAREQVGGTPISEEVPGDGELPIPDRKPRKRRRRGGRRRSGGSETAAKVEA